jgi:site-specific DNA recombinase
MRLLVPAGNTPARTVPSLVKAIVRAHDWYERVIDGRVPNLPTLVKQTGLDSRYLSRVFRCAFLAPDIVGAILDGRQPAELTFAKLSNNLPMNWAEQRKALGFPSTEPAN